MASNATNIKVQPYGAAKTVTGSSWLISYDVGKSTHYIMVDAGLFQGRVGRKHSDLNSNLVPIASKIEAIALTHAHIDHSGRLPLLVKHGFNGVIYATQPVIELSRYLLPDSAHIQKFEYERALRKLKAKRSRGEMVDDIEPLYDDDDALETMNYFVAIKRNKFIEVNNLVKLRYTNAGHAMGSSCVEVFIKTDDGDVKLLFSGDIGENNPLLKRRVPCDYDADYVFMESTYGGKLHRAFEESVIELVETMADTLSRGGNVVIPAFSAGRTQELLYTTFTYMNTHDDWIAKKLKATQFVIDSFLSVALTGVYKDNPGEFKSTIAEALKVKGNNPFDFPNLTMVSTKEESMELSMKTQTQPTIIISAAGMCNAGRVLYHLENNLPRSECTVIIPGYQAEGTLGRLLVDGSKSVNIHGRPYHVNAKIVTINAFSAHCDQEGLVKWHLNCKNPNHVLFLIHGEEEQQIALKTRLQNENPNLTIEIPQLGDVYTLSKKTYSKQATTQYRDLTLIPDKKIPATKANVLEQLKEIVQEYTGNTNETVVWGLASKIQADLEKERRLSSTRNSKKRPNSSRKHRR